MMTHDEAASLLAALSLHAVEPEEAARVEAHVRTCARCQLELDGLRETAAALGTSVETLPEGLWSSIASRLDAPRAAPPAAVTLIGEGPSRRRLASLPRALALAAAAVIVVLAVSLVNANSRVSRLQGALALARQGVVAQALATPGHRVVILTAGASRVAEFVLVPGGRGYLVSSSMPALGSGRTYQLWAIVDGSPISLGLLGPSPRSVAFTLADAHATVLAVTVEPVGGSVRPTSSPVADGRIAA